MRKEVHCQIYKLIIIVTVETAIQPRVSTVTKILSRSKLVEL